MKRLALSACVCGLLLLANGAFSSVEIVSSFDSSDEGWKVIDLPNFFGNPPNVIATYTPTYYNTGGNPGGYLSMLDPSDNWFLFSAPTAFLGDKSALLGGKIEYDMTNNPNGGNSQLWPAIALTGGGKTLYYGGTVPTPNLGWQHYSIDVTPGSWLLNSYPGGTPATAADMQTVLGNLDVFLINADIIAGYDLTTLDNVKITLVPEPSAWLALAASVIGVTALKHRKSW